MMDGEKIPVVDDSRMPFRSAYGVSRPRVSVDFSAETCGTNVKQSFADEVDVNNVVERFARTGVLPHDGREGRYLDVSDLPSYQDSLNAVRSVDAFFAGLDAETRAMFDNDPAFFAEWITDPANAEEASKLGVSAGGTAGSSAPDSGVDSPTGDGGEGEAASASSEGAV